MTGTGPTTCDSISLRGAGVIQVTQPEKGARFTLDSLLLADFCRMRPRDRVLEPGAGTGVVSLLLARKHPSLTITALELQPHLAALCRQNVQDNGLEDRIVVREQDLGASGLPRTRYDAIVANPPYTRTGSGRQSPRAERHASRHDVLAGLDSWLDLAALLRDKGRYFLVFPALRQAELAAALIARKLEPKRMRFVHALAAKPASLVLVEAVKTAGPGVEVLPPLIIASAPGVSSPELQDLYGPV